MSTDAAGVAPPLPAPPAEMSDVPADDVESEGYASHESELCALRRAVFAHDMAQVTAQLSLVATALASANSLDTYGMHPLHWACSRGWLEAVVMLHAQGAPINVRSECNSTPLFFAAFRGHCHVVTWLLEHGADATVRNFDGDTPLHFAAMGSRSDVVRVLLARATPRRRADMLAMHNKMGDTPLHVAAAFNAVQCAKDLLAAGADKDAKNLQGKSVLEVGQDLARTMDKEDGPPGILSALGYTVRRRTPAS